jgi:hypothetical protein
MFFERIRKKFSKVSTNQSVANRKPENSPLTALNNRRSTQQFQAENANKSFPDNYFDSDSLFK